MPTTERPSQDGEVYGRWPPGLDRLHLNKRAGGVMLAIAGAGLLLTVLCYPMRLLPRVAHAKFDEGTVLTWWSAMSAGSDTVAPELRNAAIALVVSGVLWTLAGGLTALDATKGRNLLCALVGAIGSLTSLVLLVGYLNGVAAEISRISTVGTVGGIVEFLGETGSGYAVSIVCCLLAAVAAVATVRRVSLG